jgi:Glycosyl transferase family 2
VARAVVAAGTAAAVLGTVHAAHNLRVLRTPRTGDGQGVPVGERVSVLLPVRDEARNVTACLRAVLAQDLVLDMEVLVLDDGSTDGTADVVRSVAGHDPRVRVIDGGNTVPDGWVGKTWACWRLAAAASGTVLVFVDADVVLAPRGLAATATLLREAGLDWVSPYPAQVAESVPERLVQPLLQWSWLTALPLLVAERGGRSTLAAANGQLLAVDATVYRRAGGHRAVRGQVLDDIMLARALTRAGGHGTLADGTRVATCRMYHGWDDLRDGYAKWLWGAFGSPAGALIAAGALSVVYVVPAVAMLVGSPVGAAGYLAAVAGRVLAARRTGGRAWPDAFAHPVSASLLAALMVDSVVRHRAATLTWKGRLVP